MMSTLRPSWSLGNVLGCHNIDVHHTVFHIFQQLHMLEKWMILLHCCYLTFCFIYLTSFKWFCESLISFLISFFLLLRWLSSSLLMHLFFFAQPAALNNSMFFSFGWLFNINESFHWPFNFSCLCFDLLVNHIKTWCLKSLDLCIKFCNIISVDQPPWSI